MTCQALGVALTVSPVRLGFGHPPLPRPAEPCIVPVVGMVPILVPIEAGINNPLNEPTTNIPILLVDQKCNNVLCSTNSIDSDSNSDLYLNNLYNSTTYHHNSQTSSYYTASTSSQYAASDNGCNPPSQYASSDNGYSSSSQYAFSDNGYNPPSQYASSDNGYCSSSQYTSSENGHPSPLQYEPSDNGYNSSSQYASSENGYTSCTESSLSISPLQYNQFEWIDKLILEARNEIKFEKESTVKKALKRKITSKETLSLSKDAFKFKSSKKHSLLGMSPTEVAQRKKEQNRIAAQRYREKQKAVEQAETEEMTYLKDRNAFLRSESERLEKEIEEIKSMMLIFMS